MKKFLLKKSNCFPYAINVSKSITTYVTSPNDKPSAEFVNKTINLTNFVKLLKCGYSFKHYYDFNQIRNNIDSIVPIDENIYAKYIHHDVLCKSKITYNVLKQPAVVSYCRFQYIFFDIENCDATKISMNETYLPNIIYKPFPSTQHKSKIRFVYILNKPMFCKYYLDLYDVIANELKKTFILDDSVKFPTKTLFGTDSDVFITSHRSLSVSMIDDNHDLLIKLLATLK